jgi:pyruvate/2-oxoglutarate dehydrogenase complex dihydrolipoamide dehydrogenase (E3) component/uncharacterized membrane protein YdjX (TVP38/TMEM64 family)
VKKKALLLIILAAIVAAYFLRPGSGPGLEGLRQHIAHLDGWRAMHPMLFIALFLLGYVIVVALSLPFALWMTLAAGALFGLASGVVIASFASSIGATLAFLASRWVLRDWVLSRFGNRLKPLSDGLARDGSAYLFTLRLIPVVPFFLVNLLMGLTTMSGLRFYVVSQLGMLPATLVYVNAGTQLAQLSSVKGLVSPPLILSFALLGLFPWLAKAVVSFLRRRRVYSRWTRPARFDRNLIVIGGGAAGLVSAYIAAATKAKVTLIETHKMGGDCLNYGCVPSKALIRSAKLAQQIRHADRYGLTNSEPEFSFRMIFERIKQIITAIEPHDSVERYEGLGVEVLQGYARIVDPWTVETTLPSGQKSTLSTRSIIVATGAAPFVPDLPGLDESGYLTSDTMWQAFSERDTAPKRLVILGGGPIGCELSQSFARLGSDVTLIEMAPRLLAKEDAEVADFANQCLKSDGVHILTGHRALSCGSDAGQKWIEVEAGEQTLRVPYDDIIVAVGRAARLGGFGLEDLGIPTGRVVETNEYLETIYPNIFAAGDVAGPYQLTHAGAHQAWFASVNALFGTFKRFKADYRALPWVTYLDPEIARVGLSEAEAKAKDIAYEVTRYDLDDLDRAIADSETHGFVKVLTPPGKDRILGVVIVGAHAGDLLAEFVLAMKHGLGLGKILSTVHSYPTMAEANKYAAGNWRKAHVNTRLLKLVERFHAWRRG